MKKTPKKLVLNRETLSQLESPERVVGGITLAGLTCDFTCRTCGNTPCVHSYAC